MLQNSIKSKSGDVVKSERKILRIFVLEVSCIFNLINRIFTITIKHFLFPDKEVNVSIDGVQISGSRDSMQPPSFLLSQKFYTIAG
jgi:hypothetical protein